MSFAFFFQPSGTITATSTGTYGTKDPTASVTENSIGHLGLSPVVSTWNDPVGERWLVFLDDLEGGSYSVQLNSSGPPPQPDSFSFSVALSGSLVTLTHPANGGTVRARNVVAWGDSTHSIVEATLTVNGAAFPGVVLRAPSTSRPYVVQFPSLSVGASTAGTLEIKNSNNDEVTINLTVDP